MHNENQKFWLICGWAASVLSQLIYWCAFIFRHNTIILSPGGRLHPAYTYAQVDAMMAQKLAPFECARHGQQLGGERPLRARQ